MAKSSKDFCNWPGGFSREAILKTIGESKDFRNPFRLPEMGDGWPKTERVKDHAKILGHEQSPGHEINMAKKGDPI
jgi:hypothetical protein